MRRLFSKIEAGHFLYDHDYDLWAAGFSQTIAGGVLSVWLKGFSNNYFCMARGQCFIFVD